MDRSKCCAVLALVAILGVLIPTHAADLLVSSVSSAKVVDAAGGGDYTTIQAAVNDLPAAGPHTVLISETERVPATDFEGDPRPAGPPAIGFDERP